jgi:hypothetical protein
MTKKEFKKNINHSEKESQVAGNSELILNFQEFWEKGARAFVPTIKEGGKPTKKPGVCCLAKKLGSDSIKIRQGKVFRGDKQVLLYELYREFDEEEYKKFLEDEIKEGHNLFIYSHQLKGGHFLHFLDIDCGKENKTRVLRILEQRFPKFSFVVESANGFHLYFRYREHLKSITKRNVKLRDDDGEFQIKEISLRGAGQGVVFPGSIHPETGEIYKIIKGSFDEIPLVDDLSEIFSLFGEGETKKRVEVVKLKVVHHSSSNFTTSTGVLFPRITCSPAEIKEIEDVLKQNDYALWDIWVNGYSPTYKKYKKENEWGFDRSDYEIDLLRAIYNGIGKSWKSKGMTYEEIAGKIKDFVLRKEYYQVRDENGNLVSTKQTKFWEKGDRYIDGILIKLQGEEGYLREKIEREIEDKVKKFFEEVIQQQQQQQFVVRHLNYPPGSGKSRIARRVLAKKIEAGELGAKAGTTVLVVVGTHNLGEEWFDDLSKRGVSVKKFSGRSEKNCKKYNEPISKFAVEHKLSFWEICKVCPEKSNCDYYDQVRWLLAKGEDEDFPDVIIATYEFFKFWLRHLLKISKIVIFDDVNVGVKKEEISLFQLGETIKILQSNVGGDEILLLDTLWKFLNQAKNKDFYQYAKQEFQNAGKYYSKSDFSSLITRIGDAIDNLFKTNIKDGDFSKPAKLPSKKVVGLLRNLIEGGEVDVKKKKVFWRVCDEMKDFHLLILGWKLTDEIKLILTRKQLGGYEEFVSDGTAENLIKSQITIELIDKKGVSSRGFDKDKKRYLNGVIREIKKGSLIFSHKKAKQLIKKELENRGWKAEEDFYVRNWFETRGLNEFLGKKINSIVFAGLPILNLKEYRKEYEFKARIAQKKGIELKSLKKEIVLKACEEIVQDICRARGQVGVKVIANSSLSIVQEILNQVSKYAEIQTGLKPTIDEELIKKNVLEDLEKYGGMDLYGLMRIHFASLLSQKTINLKDFFGKYVSGKYVFDGTRIFIREIPEGIRRNKRINRIIKSVAKGAGAEFVKIKVRGWRIKIERGKPIALEYTCEKSVFVKDFEKFRKSLFENEDEVIVAVLKNGRWVEIRDEFTEECLSELREKIETFNAKVETCIMKKTKILNGTLVERVLPNYIRLYEIAYYDKGKELIKIFWFNEKIDFKRLPVIELEEIFPVEQEHPG